MILCEIAWKRASDEEQVSVRGLEAVLWGRLPAQDRLDRAYGLWEL